MLLTARRTVIGAIGSAAVAVALLGAAPSAIAGIASGVSASTSAYLFTRPDVNAFFSGLQGKPRDGVKAEVEAYMGANPQVQAELTGIRQPLKDFKARCGDTDGDGLADVAAN